MLRLLFLSAACALCIHSARADDAGLIVRWQLDAAHLDGQHLKPAAGSIEGTFHGPPRFANEQPPALIFDGDSQARHHLALSTPDEKNLPKDALTVEAWVRVDRTAPSAGFIGLFQDNGHYERGWLLGAEDARFSFALATANTGKLTTLTSRRSIDTGYWYHVVGTYDGTLQRIYVDGQLAGEAKEQSGAIAYPERKLFTIGAYHDDNDFLALAGRIERAGLWNRALTADEIKALFDERKGLFPDIDAVPPLVADWPTYQHDNQRTGLTGERLQFPLRLNWLHVARHAPAPAWPAPAKHDYWHKKYNMQARVTYDRAYHVVSVGDAVYFATSADDSLCCLDADTGQTRWTFYAEGPIRNAPTIDGARVLFGSDDGCVYCLNSSDGALLWKYCLAPADRRIAGNERIVSVWPVRTGVLVDEGIAFFCAGLFPDQGVFQAALNVETGERIDSAPIDVSAQGYLERRAGQLFAATGRDPAGTFVKQLRRRGKGGGPELATFEQDYPFAFIGAGDVRFGGGDGKVAAFSQDGRQLWTAEVEGRAYSLAVARGRLLVSTDRGQIYCFTAAAGEPRIVEPQPALSFPYPDEETERRYKDAARWILKRSGARLGYGLVLGSGEGGLACELARASDLKIVAVEEDPEKAQRSREAFAAAGLGDRISVHQFSSAGPLPYTDYLFNVIVSQAVVDGGEFPGDRDEALRVLRPHGGTAVFALTDDGVHRRPPLDGVGDWTHMYADAANTVCSGDEHVSGEMQLQWFGQPGPRQMIDRHHRTVAPLSKDGRLFVPGEDRVIAADAYNGTLLWDVEVPGSRRVVAFRDCSYMTATSDHLYVAAADRCFGLNAQTGYEDFSFQLPLAADKIPREWGYVSTVDDLLVGSAQKQGASRRDQSYEVDTTVTYWDDIPVVCSDSLFALDRLTGKQRWRYLQPAGSVLNATLTIGDGRVFFIESAAAGTLNTRDGRAPLSALLGNGSNLVALDLASGKTLWKKPHDLSAIQHIVYACYAQGKLVVAGSKNSGADKQSAQVQYDIHVLDAANGEPVWSKTQGQGTRIGGDHGEQDHHPVIVGDKLYCEPFAYNLHTGESVADFGWLNRHRHGCGNISASAGSFFFRQSNPTMFDLATNKYSKVTTATRPGCWINIIPAGGLLLIPEASSGCSCDYPIQTSLAFLPSGRAKDDPSK